MTKRSVVLLMMLTGVIGCDEPHTNLPIQPLSFHVDKDALMGDVGGGNGYLSTHWERYTDDRTGQTIVCFSPNSHNGTSLNIACVNEESK